MLWSSSGGPLRAAIIPTISGHDPMQSILDLNRSLEPDSADADYAGRMAKQVALRVTAS